MEQMARQPPSTLRELAMLDGWSDERCSLYGSEFVSLIAAEAVFKKPRIDALGAAADVVRCSSCCFALNKGDFRFCQMCGHRLERAHD